MKHIRRVISGTVKYNLTVEIPEEDGTSVSVSVRASDTVRDLRMKLVRKGVTSWKHKFTYKGRQLGENEVFKHTGIRNGAHLVLRKDGSLFIYLFNNNINGFTIPLWALPCLTVLYYPFTIHYETLCYTSTMGNVCKSLPATLILSGCILSYLE
ncbi:hypothetical protein EOD39_19734 [Acipenser ruthenus]|uniref:Ubiquitin-like domain-containing protein n=1 Tax=Acipenser ruthenus TaxID=7906 RepID=A0A444UXA3_ACIRT|nr:hypothetical protein EOD39_19734 [Acipenser ruthenus]